MLYILQDNTIRLTRGDTAHLTVPIVTSSGEEYNMSANDTLTFSVKKTVNDTRYIIHKTVVGSNLLKLEPRDTDSLEFMKYKYDIQLTTEDGDVYTVVDTSTFEILPEVTCHA